MSAYSRFRFQHHCATASVLIVLLMLAFVTPLSADDPQSPAPPAEKKPARSAVDDALLQDLQNELLEGVDLKRRPAKPTEPARSDGDDKPPAGARPPVDEKPGDPSASSPLSRIGRDMRSVEELMPKPTRRESAVELQDRIVDELAKLIEAAEKQRSQQKGSSQSKSQQTAQRKSVEQPQQSNSAKDSSQPAQDSSKRVGETDPARPDPESVRSLMKDSWGHLPQHTREQMLQTTPERFLPQYELLIERYYKRLAEEQTSR